MNISVLMLNMSNMELLDSKDKLGHLTIVLCCEKCAKIRLRKKCTSWRFRQKIDVHVRHNVKCENCRRIVFCENKKVNGKKKMIYRFN